MTISRSLIVVLNEKINGKKLDDGIGFIGTLGIFGVGYIFI